MAAVKRIAAGAAVAVLALMAAGPALADPRSGEYSMEVRIVQEQAGIGGTVTAQAYIDAGGAGAYQAAQWQLVYPSNALTFASADASAGSPGECGFTSHQGGNTVLLGCIDLTGANLTFSGPAFDVTFTCEAEGVIEVFLSEDKTFVAGENTEQRPIHRHADTVTCGAGGAVITPPSPTPIPEQPVATRPPAEATAARETAVAGATPARSAADPQGAETREPGSGERTPESATATARAGGIGADDDAAAGGSDGDDAGSAEGDGGGSATPWIIGGVVAAALALGGGAFWYYRRASAA